MKEKLRKSGIDVLGEVPWGTHICQFYETKEDLLKTIVPFMQAGLCGNELCVWVTSPVITREEAVRSLGKTLPGVDRYISKGQLEVANPADIYLKGSSFDANKALQSWGDRLSKALAMGYDGIRVTGDPSFLEKKDWSDLMEYEKTADGSIQKLRMLAICTYDQRRYGTTEIINAFANHAFALVKADSGWKLVESSERKRAEDVRRDNEQILQDIIDGSPAMVFIKDLEGRFITINKRMEEVAGLSLEKIKGKTDFEIVPKEMADFYREHDRRVRESGHAIQLEEVVDCVDGERRVFLANKFPLFDSSGRMYGTGAISHDITGRKESERKLLESEQRYRGLYESIRDGIVRTDLEGGFLDCNQAFLDMLGYTKEEILKLSYKQITPGKWLVVSAEKIRDHIIGRGYSDLYEKEYIRKDGSTCPISVRAWLIRDAEGNPAEMWGIVRDITEQKKAGEDIRKLNGELKDNVAQLEEANGELEAFNFSLAHDLSTPLRVIDGFAKMLEKYYSDKLDEEGKEFIRTIRGSAQKMGEFISDLLHLSRLGKSEIIKSGVDMAGLARPLSDELKAMTPGRDLEFRIKELPAAFGEPTLIRQVFFNLMANAVKFTKPREKAIIEVGGYGAENENIYYVKDNGVGFDMEHAGKVFGVFKRLHTEKEFEGTGAGLAIVQRIVHRHGGRVWAEGAVNSGATFHFSLPK